VENFVKRLQLVRKKLLPLLLCVAVAGSQVPVMAADGGGEYTDRISWMKFL